MVDKLTEEEKERYELIDNKIIAFQMQNREQNLAKDNDEVRKRFRAMKDTTEEQVADYTKSIRDYCNRIANLESDNEKLKKTVAELESRIQVNLDKADKALTDLGRQKDDEKKQLEAEMERIKDENDGLSEFKSKQDTLI